MSTHSSPIQDLKIAHSLYFGNTKYFLQRNFSSTGKEKFEQHILY